MYLFFIRDFNDIDHTTPVVWKMVRSHYPVTVYCLNPRYDIHKDYRIHFLKKIGVDIDYLYNDDHRSLGWEHRILRFLYFSIFAIERQINTIEYRCLSPLKKHIGRYARMIGDRLYLRAKNKFYETQWAADLIRRKHAKALCFDWVKPKHSVVDVLLKAADSLKIPAFAMPHGVFVYTNNNITIESRPLEAYDKLNRYDGVIVQNLLFREFMTRSGLNPKKIHVLGSARYCDEWIQQNRKILPRTLDADAHGANGLKITFMTTKLRYRINSRKLSSTLNFLAKFDGLDFKIKPHTRPATAEENDIYERLPIDNGKDISSVELCEWADAVIVIGSSIMIEPLIQNKPVLYLKYLHENTTIYEEYGACWIIRSEDELKGALNQLKRNREKVAYSAESVNRFKSDIIYNNDMERDILKDYVDFIVSFKKR
jgi:hypothetical protein